MSSKGSLTIVGTGIKGRAQLTEESKAHILIADVVFYMVSDNVVAQWILQNHKDARDLYIRYADDKVRIDTYTQMRLEMIAEVRANKRVVAVFYGHPGVFVHPSHKSIAEARYHGYEAEMLPAISAEDCLFADVGVDPALPGYQTFEATDLLLNAREICTDLHVVIWQVGCVGLFGFNFQAFDNKYFQQLVDYLLKYYGPDHEVVIYIAAQYPTQPPQLDRSKIKDLKASMVSSISTFYIPPYTRKSPNLEVAAKFFGVEVKELEGKDLSHDANSKGALQYLTAEKRGTLLELLRHRKEKHGPKATPLGQYLLRLGLEPVLASAHIADPVATTKEHALNLHPQEFEAIVSGNFAAVRDALRNKDFEPPLSGSDLRVNKQATQKSGQKKGSLVIVGHGIKGPVQLTAEAVSHIQNADEVFFLACDPLTEQWIRSNNPNSHDLHTWYDNSRPRIDTYAMMTLDMVEEVKKGKDVVGVFYGHPGVFVNPGHNAVAEARRLGYYAEMLPGISAADCLFADLGFDPALPGTLTFEATDLLLHQRNISTDLHVVIWQIGSVGELGYAESGFTNQHLSVLIDYLVAVYGKDYKVTHYVGAQYPTQGPYFKTVPLSALASEKITSISTLYIPPSVQKQMLADVAKVFDENYLDAKVADEETRKKRIMDELQSRTPPPGYRQVPRSTKLGSFLIKLSEDTVLARCFLENPAQVVGAADLHPQEAEALTNRHYRHIGVLLLDHTLA